MAVKGKGAKFWLWDSSLATPALVKVGDVTTVKPPARTRDTIDTTTHDSVGDYREFISSLIDAGEATFGINWDPGDETDTLVEAIFAGGELSSFAIDVNTSSGTQRRIAGSMVMTGYEPDDVVIDDKMSATVTLKVSGPLTFAEAPAV